MRDLLGDTDPRPGAPAGTTWHGYCDVADIERILWRSGEDGAMGIAPEVGLVPAQHMLPTAALVAYAGLLALPGNEIEQAVSRELVENPALVADDVTATAQNTQAAMASTRSVDGSRDSGWRVPGRAWADPDEQEPERPAREGWSDSLLRDLRLELVAEDGDLADLVVGSLDERGYLTEDVPELARIGGADRSRIEGVVQMLRDVGPPGVGARDARDCLLLQLERLEGAGIRRPVVRAILTDHMEALARGRLTAIATELGVEHGSVLEARAFIRRELRPYPCVQGAAWLVPDHDDPGVVRPDVAIFERPDAPGSFDVEVLEAERFQLHVDPTYRTAAREADGQCIAELVRRADFFLARLRERWTTLRRVTALVAERERAFLCGTSSEYVPLTRATVATALGIHQSTVSRATAEKYVQLPSLQVVAFAELFDASIGARSLLRSIVEAEAWPLSDSELCERMERAGYPVARRTVAKYRDRLGILPSTGR